MSASSTRRREVIVPPHGANLLRQWVNRCLLGSILEANLYSGCRKILRPARFVFTSLDSSLTLADCGYKAAKLRMLERNYLHQESIDAALVLWKRRVDTDKYGSVGFTTYNHFSKGTGKGRASIMGPCIQSVTITLLKKGQVAVDVFYRTTELLKKFPADLVFIRDVLLPPFGLPQKSLTLTCHFANVTVHPMYWVTIIPHLDDPLEALRDMHEKDSYFHDWVVKWTARYICPQYSRGIDKFSQALRVRKDALERIRPSVMKPLQKYLVANHPGYRGDLKEEDDD